MASSANSIDRRLTARLVPAGLLVFVSLAFALLFAAPAGAVVKTIGTTKVGLQPRSETLVYPGDSGLGTDPGGYANATGAPILPSSKTYAIYWDPDDLYDGDWQHLIDTFFHEMGAGSGSLETEFAVDSQYTDAANQHASYSSTFEGAYTDTSSYPAAGCTDPDPSELGASATCLTDAQIRGALEEFIHSHGLPRGMGTIYYVLTPPGVAVCLDDGGPTGHCSDGVTTNESYANSFCSYHSDIDPTGSTTGDSKTILYAVIPWIAGNLGDPKLNEGAKPVSGYACQDGGFDPASEPLEEQEHAKEENSAEKEALEKMDPEERLKAEEERARQRFFEGPHQQEPNQPKERSPDGWWDTGLADLIVSQIGVEQQNTVTDPLLNAWQDPDGNEDTDECRDFFAPAIGGSPNPEPHTHAGTLFNQVLNGGHYYINDAFNLAALELPYPAIPCINAVALVPLFTVPNPVNAGEIVGFDGMESDISLDWGTKYTNGTPSPTYANYEWNFGDGSPTVSGYAPGASFGNSSNAPCEGPWSAPCAASTFHSYQYGGKYVVTLTVTDTGGNVAQLAKEITVDGPPAPSSNSSVVSASSAASATQAGGSSSGSRPPRVYGPPVVYEAALSRSLRMALRHGLAVRYSVNEQVAGSLQVILSKRVAQRLHIYGPVASGLPSGSEPSVVVARTIVVTTKAGHSTIRIKFAKQVAAHLRKLRRVSFVLRMVVRNASTLNPLTATVLSTVPLD